MIYSKPSCGGVSISGDLEGNKSCLPCDKIKPLYSLQYVCKLSFYFALVHSRLHYECNLIIKCSLSLFSCISGHIVIFLPTIVVWVKNKWQQISSTQEATGTKHQHMQRVSSKDAAQWNLLKCHRKPIFHSKYCSRLDFGVRLTCDQLTISAQPVWPASLPEAWTSYG